MPIGRARKGKKPLKPASSRTKRAIQAGDFRAKSSKTFAVPLFAAFAAWADEDLRRRWLDAPDIEFDEVDVGQNLHARGPNDSSIEIRFEAGGPGKCRVVVETTKLANAAAVERIKTFWLERLTRLRAYLGA